MKRLRAWLRDWLGINDVDTGIGLLSQATDLALEAESAERQALTGVVEKMAETNRGLATALQAVAAQLNRNTVMMQRWSTQSATLGDIEARHARREAKAEAVAANGHARVITPEGL